MKVTDLKTGDKVRSFDFEHIKDCYYEGNVTNIVRMEGCRRYEIEVTKKVFKGKETFNRSDIIYPPVNGTMSWTGKETNLVEVI